MKIKGLLLRWTYRLICNFAIIIKFYAILDLKSLFDYLIVMIFKCLEFIFLPGATKFLIFVFFKGADLMPGAGGVEATVFILQGLPRCSTPP